MVCCVYLQSLRSERWDSTSINTADSLKALGELAQKVMAEVGHVLQAVSSNGRMRQHLTPGPACVDRLLWLCTRTGMAQGGRLMRDRDTPTVCSLPQNWELRAALEHKSSECEELRQDFSKLQQLVKRPSKIPEPCKVPLVHKRRSYYEAVSEGCLCTMDQGQVLSDKGEVLPNCL